jgi:ABC-type molybdenum transport system ATPase subunit/photorepair protein PhrA
MVLTILKTLLSKHRFHPQPPAPGVFPYTYQWSQQAASTSEPRQPPSIRHLTFSKPSPTGEFTDFTARYGALQEDDKDTLLQFFRESLYPSPTEEAIEAVSCTLGIKHLISLPVVALSSGQTRRSRIAAGLLARPRMLILEDPFAGLDVQSRAQIADMLGAVNSGKRKLLSSEADDAMRLVLSLRGTGAVGMPAFVTHVARVVGGEVETLPKEEYVDKVAGEEKQHVVPDLSRTARKTKTPAAPVVDAQNVSIAYGDKKVSLCLSYRSRLIITQVLDDVSWRILPGDRWHLQGSNGSGKTTLLSLVLGHHPRSFSLPAERLTLFSRPRRETATPTLKRKIGHASPEIFAAFPRGMGLSAGEVVGTGYEGVFSRRRMSEEQQKRILQLLEPFTDLLAVKRNSTSTVNEIYNSDFAHFPPNQQALLLFLRAIVARPPLLILDEASQGMDEASWARCRTLLEAEWAVMAEDEAQAVVVVSHWEEEVSPEHFQIGTR